MDLLKGRYGRLSSIKWISFRGVYKKGLFGAIWRPFGAIFGAKKGLAIFENYVSYLFIWRIRRDKNNYSKDSLPNAPNTNNHGERKIFGIAKRRPRRMVRNCKNILFVRMNLSKIFLIVFTSFLKLVIF